MRVHLFVVLLLCLLLPDIHAQDAPIPPYALPDGASSSASPADDVVRGLVRDVVVEGARETEEAWRVLAALGRRAVPEVVAALPRSEWFARSLLMSALAESGVPEVESVLLQGAGDPSWAVRQMAAVGLGREPCTHVEDALLRLCADPSWRVRDAAAHSLRRQASRGRVDRDRTIAALLRLTADPDKDLRLRAIVELGSLRAAEGKATYLKGFEGDDAEVRETCFRALLGLDDVREDIIAALETALETREGSDFLAAAQKYAELTGARILKLENTLYKLLQTLRSNSSRAAKVFEEIGRPAVPVLMEELRRHQRPSRLSTRETLDRTILDIVQNILGKDAAPILREILTDWDALDARRYAAVLARRFHPRTLLPTFREMYFKEGFYDLRASLLQGIAAADPADLPDFLENAVRSGDYQLQRAAFNILLTRGDIDLSVALLAAVADENDPRIASKFMRLLYEQRNPGLFGAAAELLTRAHPDLRTLGAEWIGYVPEQDKTLRLLSEAFADEDGRDRGEKDGEEEGAETDEAAEYRRERIDERRKLVLCAILGSAGRAGGAKALPLLRRGAADPNPFVRERALFEASKIRGPEVLALALELLDSETDDSPILEAMKILVSSDAPEATARAALELDGTTARRRTAMLRALKEVEVAAVPDALLAGLRGGKWEADARQMAVDVLTNHGTAEHLPVLSGIAAKDPVPEIRADAVRALGELGLEEAAPTLISLLPEPGISFDDLKDEDRLLVEEVILALGYLGPTDAVPRLLDMLAVEWPLALLDATKDRRHFSAANLIVTSLGRIGDPRALSPLVRLLFTPELHRFYALLTKNPPRGQANLLGSLVKALVRYPDKDLVRAGHGVLGGLRATGEAFRVDERYLNHLGELFSDPRRRGIRRPQPRRAFATLLFSLVTEVVPRESNQDLTALRYRAGREAEQHRFAQAAETQKRAVELGAILEPLAHHRDRHYLLAERDLLCGLALMDAGDKEEGLLLYRRARDRDPEDPRIENLFAWWLAETGRNLEEALIAAESAGRRAASDADVLDTLGWVLFRLGRYEAAASVLRDAMELDEKRVERAGEGAYQSPLIVYHYAATAAGAGHLKVAGAGLIETIAMDDTFTEPARSSGYFEALKKAGILEEAIRRGLEAIPK